MAGTDQLALSIDIGTSSTRVLLWDDTGREIPTVRAQVQYQMRTTPDGGMEMDPEELLAHVAECLDTAMAKASNSAANIKAVGISTFWHSVIGIDDAGKAVTPILNWADNRSAAVAKRLRNDLDSHAIHARTGCVIHPSYYPAKLVWLRETMPVLFYRVCRFVSPSEYLFGRLFGLEAIKVSVSMASGTGLFHQTDQCWDQDLLSHIGIDQERLSEIVDLTQHSIGFTPEFRDRWPTLHSAPFFPAVGDGACGNIGSGCVEPDRLAINLGTSGAIRAMWSEPKGDEGKPASKSPPPGLWRYRVDSKRPVIGAAFSDGGHVYAWMSRTLQLPPEEQLENLIDAMPPGGHGLTFMPFLAGERSMGWNPDARASLIGMNLDTDPLDILRASMEAVALQFALAADRLRALFPQANRIVASGGALGHSAAWRRMFADAIGSPLTVAAEPEASSRGAALLALEAAGCIPSTSSAPARLGETIEPRPAAHARYMEMLARQQSVYEKLG